MIELFGYEPMFPERIGIFEQELALVQHPELRKFLCFCLDHAPQYFFYVPASTSGKHHPAYALGEGGLVRHTKAAIGIAQCLANTDIINYYGGTRTTYDPSKVDMLYAALLLHDMYKCGDEEDATRTVFEHPRIASRRVVELWSMFDKDSENIPWHILAISNAIHSHMGQWNKSAKSDVVLPTPMDNGYNGWFYRLVHICDFLASRKCLEYNFDEHLR